MLSRSSAAAARLPLQTGRKAALAQRIAASPSASTSASASAPASACPACWRHLSSTSTTRLPRQLGRQVYGRVYPAAEHPTTPLRPAEDSDQGQRTSARPTTPYSDPDVPWFMEAEEVELSEYASDPQDTSSEATPSSFSEALASAHFEYIPETVVQGVPTAILNLQEHLLHGPISNLLARPPSRDEDLPAPISFIHPYSLSADPSNDAFGKTDYVVVVQVKSSAAGSVRKVAKEVGNFLKHQPPPPVESQSALDLDDLLGPDRSAHERYQRTPEDASVASAASALPPRPKGMSRIEHELGKKLPDWAVHRIALSRKFPEGWKPPKILSREAQDGLRLLHGSDPDRFNVEELALKFRISRESVRRILRGGKWNISSEARARQNQRAKERIADSIASRPERWSREESEIAEIRRMQEEGSELVDEGESPVVEGEEDGDIELESESSELDEPVKRPVYPVRYEGLVVSSSDVAASGMTAKAPSKGSHVSRGDGHWCLVDAEWCMVHVMTEQARFRYDIEGMWRELEAEAETAAMLPRGHSITSDAAGTSQRSKRSVFGENLNARPRSLKSTGNFRMFSTSTRSRLASEASPSSAETGPKLDLPETLNQLLERCSSALTVSSDTVSEGIPVVAQGWLRSARKQKSVTFLEVSDGTLVGNRALQAVIRHGKQDASSAITDAARDLSGLTTGTALRLEGRMKKGRGSKQGQEVELDVKSWQVVGSCDATYPLAVQQQLQTGTKSRATGGAATATESAEARSETSIAGYQASQAERRSPHLRGRLPRHGAVLRTRQRLETGMAEWFEQHDFTKVACPILTSSDCEGAGEVFQVVADSDVRSLPTPASPAAEAAQQHLSSFWSSTPAYLTVSSQLHLEAIGLGLSRVWTMNPSFRAEGSATNRHLAEFWMVEAEMYWTAPLPPSTADHSASAAATGRNRTAEENERALDTLMDSCEGLVKSAIRAALYGRKGAKEDMDLLLSHTTTSPSPATTTEGHLELLHRILTQPRWTRLSYSAAIDLLQERHVSHPSGALFSTAPEWGASLSSEQERYLASPACFDGPVFVTHYPRQIKAFYMRSNGDATAADTDGRGETVAAFDLLIPTLGELVGGSLREERAEVLQRRFHPDAASAEQGARGESEDEERKAHALDWYTKDLRRYGGTPHGGFGLGMERLLSWVTHTENVKDVNTFARTKGVVRF